MNGAAEESLTYRVYRYLKEPDAFLVQFYPDPTLAPFEAAYLPGAGAVSLATLHEALSTPQAQDFAAVLDPIDQLEHVTALCHALREQDPALVEFRLPLTDFQDGIAAMEEFFQELDAKTSREESLAIASTFELLAVLLMDDAAALHWTIERERVNSRRIEVYEYVEEPGSLLLVHFEPEEREVQLCAYHPGAAVSLKSPLFLQAIRAFVTTRQLGDAPLPRKATRLFAPHDFPLAAQRCARALVALGEGRGSTHDFSRGEIFPAEPALALKKRTPPHPYSVTLH